MLIAIEWAAKIAVPRPATILAKIKSPALRTSYSIAAGTPILTRLDIMPF